MIELFKEFGFEAAHRLPNVPAGPQVRPPARPLVPGGGPRARARSGPSRAGSSTSPSSTAAWQPLHEALDHRYLNEVPGLENPTSEVLAMWIWDALAPTLPGLSQVVVRETCTSGCRYRGPDRDRP